VTQNEGEELALSGRWDKGGLQEARTAPVRNSKALQLASLRWQEYNALLAAYFPNVKAD
jgi:hypothetical protein